MIKSLILLASIVIAVFVWTGVLEITPHFDRLSAVPSILKESLADKGLYRGILVKGTQYKREAEQWLIKDEKQQLELALKYVKSDAEHLAARGDDMSSSDTEELVHETSLLVSSMERASDLIANVSIDEVARIRESARDSFSKAGEALAKVTALREKNQKLNEELEELATTLEKHIGKVNVTGENTGTVAGSNSKDAISSENN